MSDKLYELTCGTHYPTQFEKDYQQLLEGNADLRAELKAARAVIGNLAACKRQVRGPEPNTYVIVGELLYHVDEARAYLAKYGELEHIEAGCAVE